ncbi:hypothetical protein CDAR_377371 [Caerostris darwini]|uniref:Uncharacterized protein n=1 Tax=Caerostris darwini TaxID=1538125 RepID=A0AAV4VZT3_9ARAC|nr:hypothetical protein CDAR_377371 [Caerostris darwini]
MVTLRGAPAGVFGDADPSIIPASEIDSWSLSLARHPRVPMPWSRAHWSRLHHIRWKSNHSGRRLIPKKQPMGVPYHGMFVLSVAVQPSIKCICFPNNTPEGEMHKPVGLFRINLWDVPGRCLLQISARSPGHTADEKSQKQVHPLLTTAAAIEVKWTEGKRSLDTACREICARIARSSDAGYFVLLDNFSDLPKSPFLVLVRGGRVHRLRLLRAASIL